ncbi:MAG: response regulator [Proteobacteria bacterium]|nr:response regulator [Desulfobulbaceae bacterium]MBU4152829.1 response regulator [Pseudomonadota bacterium]
MKVLLVDDEEELVSTLAERLSFRGIDVGWATGGESALQKISEQRYDVAVLDMKMPKITGLELKKELAEKCPHMKYIFMTGHGSEEDFKRVASEAGTEYYLVKPVKIEDLVQKLNEVFGT